MTFFSCTARLWNSMPIECFPLTYDLNAFKSRINWRLFVCRFFPYSFPMILNFMFFPFLQLHAS